MKLNIGPLQNIPTKISFNNEIMNIILPCLEGFVKHLFKEKLRLCRGGQARTSGKEKLEGGLGRRTAAILCYIYWQLAS